MGPPTMAPRTGSTWERVNPTVSLIAGPARPVTIASTAVLRPLPQDHDLHRVEQDRQVEEQRLVLDVEQVVLELLHRVLEARAVPIIDLRPARQPGLDDVALAEVGDLRRQLVDEHRPLGPRADDRHLADEHVEELRQLVEPRPPYEPSGARDPRVVLGRP